LGNPGSMTVVKPTRYSTLRPERPRIPDLRKRPLVRCCFSLLAAILLQAGCGRPSARPPRANGENVGTPVAERPKLAARPAGKPVPPFPLSVPAAMPQQLDGKDLKAMEDGELLGRANQAIEEGDYSRAAAFQYWYVEKSKTGMYNLACCLARMRRNDPAFYWLQLGAIEEGLDADLAQRDGDLTSLKSDPRWPRVLQYVVDCNRYFESAPIARTTLILPKGYLKSTPIPAIIWLHGVASCPEQFVNDGCQEYVDELNVALIGVSGTRARGPRSFVWAEDPEKDAKRLHDALEEVSDRVSIKKGHVITFGFSQGAQVGLDIAVRYPEEYAGSIVLSPGAQPHLNDLKPAPLLTRRGFVLSCGGDEHPGNVKLTAQDADWLRHAEARVIHKTYPNVSAHSFPSDFYERFPEWVRFILKVRAE
jgi:predicted esterase